MCSLDSRPHHKAKTSVSNRTVSHMVYSNVTCMAQNKLQFVSRGNLIPTYHFLLQQSPQMTSLDLPVTTEYLNMHMKCDPNKWKTRNQDVHASRMFPS